ncbi:DUF6207 family protein [Streptomyces sp. NPDC088812]|uniref:DUF6207 family protein n=1 Tax=Streptomyces sp. NPDC088812 TaxID=3365905 RepID=UPI0037FCD444
MTAAFALQELLAARIAPADRTPRKPGEPCVRLRFLRDRHQPTAGSRRVPAPPAPHNDRGRDPDRASWAIGGACRLIRRGRCVRPHRAQPIRGQQPSPDG